MLFGVGFNVFGLVCSAVYYLHVSVSRLITSAGEERAGFSAIDYSMT